MFREENPRLCSENCVVLRSSTSHRQSSLTGSDGHQHGRMQEDGLGPSAVRAGVPYDGLAKTLIPELGSLRKLTGCLRRKVLSPCICASIGRKRRRWTASGKRRR